MQDNPFDDPAVQQNANAGPPPAPQQSNVYGGDNAYDDAPAQVNVDMAMQAAAYIPAEQKQQLAVSAGSAMANQAMGQAQNEYDESAKTQQDHNQRPPPPPFCIKLMNWFPIRLASFGGGVLLLACPILDFIIGSPAFIQAFIYIYLMGFGLVVIASESPSWKATRKAQLGIFFWFRLMSRMWGRAWFYLFISILCFAGLQSKDSNAVFTVIAGVYLMIISMLSFMFSRMAGKKFARLREFIAAGSEGDQMVGRFMRKFDELDKGGKEGTIGSAEIVKVMEQAGRTISNSERHALQTFLDESCNGYVSKEDWMKMLVEQYQGKDFKQKFL